jgi:phosphatidylglycerophosphatase A
MKQSWNSFIATWFGSGNAPFAPGTMGSLAALPIAYVVHSVFGGAVLAVMALSTFILGVWVSEIYMEMNQRKDDPKEVVIDEVAGQWLLLSVMPLNIYGYVLGFVLFRALDIFKPWPISWVDKNVKGGLGVMFDDILAAFIGLMLFLIIGSLIPAEYVTPFYE